MNLKDKDPIIIKNFFPEQRYSGIMNVVQSLEKNSWSHQATWGRYTMSNKWLDKIGIYEIDRARKIFDNNNILFTYSLLSYYSEGSSLPMHLDDNACTYTLDVCLYAKKPWPLIVEGKEYLLENNEALGFYGNDQIHGRTDFEPGNEVLMLFLHFADKNHWWFQANNKECV